MNEIGQLLLTSPNPDTRSGALIIFGTLQPPPPEIVAVFLALLKQTDTEVQAQGPSIIFELVHIAPENPEVIEAVHEFLSKPLDSKSKVDVISALGEPRVKDARIIATVISCVDDPDASVRVASVQSLLGMGQSALQQRSPRRNDSTKIPTSLQAWRPRQSIPHNNNSGDKSGERTQ